MSDSLELLQVLQRDLLSIMDGRLENVDRLAAELEAHIADFKTLLNRNRRNDKSREQLNHGTNTSSPITIDGLEYTITPDFKDAALTVANEVDLDELEAARLCLLVQEEMDQVDETLPYRAVLRFQTERRTLLDCFRLILKRSLDASENGDEISDMMQTIVRLVVSGDGSAALQQSAYWRKCIDSLTEVEDSMKKTQGHIQAMAMTGQAAQSVRGEALQVQRMFLAHQHEAIAAIMCYLIRAHQVVLEDYRSFLTKAAASDLGSDLLSHFSAILIAGASHFGSDNAPISQSAALDTHRLFIDSPAKLSWKNRPLGAAATVWWLAEYSARVEDAAGRDEVDKTFFRALDEGAFQLMLSVADFYKPEVWHDPAKAGLVRFLLDSTDRFPRDAVAPSADFAQLTMQELQVFTETMVSSMHGALRKLKTEEDQKRRNHGLDDQSYEMHLERFLLVIAYAYQDDVVAAMDFWGDTESGLYGFLRWTSRRLPTPRVAAFCEMLRSLANGDKAATAAHNFLLEDIATLPARGRRSFSLSWQQMFSELELYSASIKNKPAPTLPDTTHDPDIIEAETPIMLEAYLRLIAHVIRNSGVARDWVTREQSFKLHECLLQLAQSAIPASVQACCFEVLSTLAAGNTTDVRDGLWFALDQWLTGADDQRKGSRRDHDKLYLQRIASDAEVASAFINLLNALIARPTVLDDLPFSEHLGSTRRQHGIEYYVDFVLSMALPLSASEQSVNVDRMQMFVLRHACFTFVQTCLSGFKENLAALNNNPPNAFSAYARSHPFARTMEHLFNDQVIAILFQTAEQNPDELRTLPASSPLVQAVCVSLNIVNLVLDKQATYFDIVRPLIKTQSVRREQTVSNPAFASFDDVILAYLDVVGYLAGFMSCPHEEICFVAIETLKKMSVSRKIATQVEPGAPKRVVSRLLSRLADSGEALQIELRQSFVAHDLDLESGSSQLSRTQAILDLLMTNLSADSTVPCLAHCLLGFSCGPTTVTIADDSLFSHGRALFHSVASMAVLLPQDDQGKHLSALQNTRTRCLGILARLSSSTLTSQIAVAELRSIDFLPALQASLHPVDEHATWEDCSAMDPSIWLGNGAAALESFLKEREYLCNLITSDLQSGKPSNHPVVFALTLLDFFDVEVAQPVEVGLKYMSQFDASAYVTTTSNQTEIVDISQVEQALALKKRQLSKGGQIQDQPQEQQVDDEIAALLTSIKSFNDHKAITTARLETLEAWVDLMAISIIPTNDASTLQYTMQQVMPRFDRALNTDMEAVSQLAKVLLMAARTVQAIGNLPQAPSGTLLEESLYHAYQSCLQAIQEGNSDAGLRDICYRICSIILELSITKPESTTRLSERVILVVAEDAFANRGVTRIAALLFLDAVLREIHRTGKSPTLLRTLQKINFLAVLIDSSISTIAVVFRDDRVDHSTSLAYFHAAATVLLRMAQIPGGAQLVLNCGFIAAVQESGLFSTDPDIGLDIDNVAALQEFYRLLAAILRILVAIVVSRGNGDGATMQTVRKFLSDNRMSMAAVFKLLSRQEKAGPNKKADALDIADELGRLIHITSFLEEDEYFLDASGRQQSFT